ncbi:MAG: Mur ligase family protein [Candidatus Dojkabacteria bacterium]|nr:MAG: Mur ligase family protein [Candidatus Dojkabacteria bacterium]
MAKLPNLLKLFNFFLPFIDPLYILQLEEYSTKRLIKWMRKFYWRRNIQVREKLVFTARVKITLLGSLVVWGLQFLITLYFLQASYLFGLVLIPFLFLSPYLIVLTCNYLISLLEDIPKAKVRARASHKRLKNERMKVVVIAGSFGKTTTKNFLNELVRYSYRTQMIPGNINTPGGIANWILQELRPDTELLLAEVDSYSRGEIAKSAHILSADICILTTIGGQHEERFASAEDLAAALLEVFTASPETAVKITTAEIRDTYRLNNITITTPLNAANTSLSETNKHNLAFALAACKELHIDSHLIETTIPTLAPPERRQEVTTLFGYPGIDDSYNISRQSAEAGILQARKLAQQHNKKLLVITAGIPELAKEKAHHNKELGELLSENADHTIILKSDFAETIVSGFSDMEKYTCIPSLSDFLYSETQKFKTEEWFLLFQPELHDLYY